MPRYERPVPIDTRAVIKKLNEILSSSANPNIKRKVIAELLKETFKAQACIIALANPSQNEEMKLDVFTGEIPNIEFSGEKEKKAYLKSILETVEHSLKLAEERTTEISIISMIKMGENKFNGLLSTFIDYKNEKIGMIIIVKEIKPSKGNQQALNCFRVHINSIIGPSL